MSIVSCALFLPSTSDSSVFDVRKRLFLLNIICICYFSAFCVHFAFLAKGDFVFFQFVLTQWVFLAVPPFCHFRFLFSVLSFSFPISILFFYMHTQYIVVELNHLKKDIWHICNQPFLTLRYHFLRKGDVQSKKKTIIWCFRN